MYRFMHQAAVAPLSPFPPQSFSRDPVSFSRERYNNLRVKTESKCFAYTLPKCSCKSGIQKVHCWKSWVLMANVRRGQYQQLADLVHERHCQLLFAAEIRSSLACAPFGAASCFYITLLYLRLQQFTTAIAMGNNSNAGPYI